MTRSRRAAAGVLTPLLAMLLVTACTSAAHPTSTTAPASAPVSVSTSTPTSAPTTASIPPSGVASSPAPSDAGTSSPVTGPASTAATPQVAGSLLWGGYHADQARTGAVAAMPSLRRATRAWSADLGDAVYGQPLVADGRVIAATEGNRVVALDPANGHIVWSRTLGSPLTDVDAVAGCGDVDPLGITSTPVVDPATGVVYVVGEISDGSGSVHHQLVGFRIATGAITVSDDVDPPLPAGENAVNLLQRASLALANGRVYVSYGGNSGDCGSYHGWVVAVAETGAPRLLSFEVAADGEGGAIWESGGAPAVSTTGNIYVTTGNANPDPPQGGPDPKQYTESVVELTPDLEPVASFKDRIAGGDEDLATGNPVLLPDGTVFAVGKTDVGYVLSQQTLRQVAAIQGVCDSDPDGGPAYDRATNTIFVPCRGGGIQEVDLTTRSLGPRLSGANGAPVVIGTDVWAVQYPDGTLTEYDAASGATVQTLSVGSSIPSFTSPSAGLGLVLVGTDHGVTAFG